MAFRIDWVRYRLLVVAPAALLAPPIEGGPAPIEGSC